MRIRLISLALPALAMLCLASRPSLADDQKEGGPRLKIEGQLTTDDGKDTVRFSCYAKIHSFKMKAGKSYQIDMKSTDLDSYLRLEDPSGKQVAKDDDSGGNHDARIVYKAAKDGEYKIIATTFGGGMTGKYTLTVAEAAAPKVGTLARLGETIESELTTKDVRDRNRNGSYAKIYPIKLEAGKTYQIDMKSRELDSYLRLEDPSGKQVAKDDDSGGNLDARIVYKAEKDGEYKIIATTFAPGLTGKYTLTVAKVAGPKLAAAARLGEMIESELTKMDERDPNRNSSYAKIHPIKLEAGKTYQIDMRSADLDSYLRLEDPSGQQVAFDDDSGGNLNARIVHKALKDGEYRIIATTFVPNATGAYTLRVASLDEEKK
jgi:hypothetical protein